MPLLFFLLIILGIYAEFAVAVSVAEEIGIAGVLLATFATAAIGMWIVRLQGFDVYRKINQAAARGEPPVEPMLHGVLLLFAGFLLFLPGFITDAIGALLLVPPVRSFLIARGIWRHIGAYRTATTRAPDGGIIIEGEYTSEEKNGKRTAIGRDG